MKSSDLMGEDLGFLKNDPLGYVMYVFPWDSERSIQQVKLLSPWKERYGLPAADGIKYGPDAWVCEFLDDLAIEIKDRSYDGQKAVAPIKFSTSSGHGIGKSALVSWLIKFILDTRPMSRGVITANTSDQLRTKTWAELGKWHRLSLTEHLYDYTLGKGSMALNRKGFKGLWGATAQTCREENSEAFQGLHAADSTPFFIFDEASGIPNKIWEARAGGATDGEPMTFDFGNPTRNTGYFFNNCMGEYRDRHIVRCIDSRSVQITNKDLFNEWEEDYGTESDFFKVKVRGIFPSQSSVQFINSDDVKIAMRRELPDKEIAPLILGVDIARFGENDTVIFPRIGSDARSFPFKRFNGLDTMQIVDQIINTIEEFRLIGKPCSAIFIDGGGAGGGPVDRLRQLGYNPIEVQFGSRPTNSRYRLKGDEIWGNMKDGLNKLCLPNDSTLMSQLVEREYAFTINGRMALESKRDIKKRGGKSPDIADALALTYTSVVASIDSTISKPLFYKHEYDPLEAIK